MVKSELSELTIQEYEDVSKILSDESKGNFEKYIDILVYLGLEIDDAESVPLKSLLEFIKAFVEGEIEMHLNPIINIDGYDYRAIEEGETEPRITPRVTKHIEKILSSGHKGHLSEIAAVLLRKEGLSNKEHYEPAHIKHKAKLIRENLKASDVLPYIIFATNGILTNLKDFVDGVS